MKVLAFICLAFSTALAHAEPQFFGIYVNGVKTGYYSSNEKLETYEGKPALKTEGHWETLGNVGGIVTKSTTDSVSWSSQDNRPLHEISKSKTGKYAVNVDAVFGEKTVEIDIELMEKKSHKSLPIPDGLLVGDSIKAIVAKTPTPGQTLPIWVFQSGNQTIAKAEMKYVGPSSYTEGGEKHPANLIELAAEGVVGKFFLDSKGDLLRQELPRGMVIQSESKSVAMAKVDKDALPDLQEVNSLKANKPIDDALTLTRLKLRISGDDLSKAPSDDIQTVTKDGDGWIVDIHPPLMSAAKPFSIEEVGKGKEEWLKPSKYMPSDSDEFKKLSTKIIGKKKDVTECILAIHAYVNKTLKGNYGTNPGRDASKILKDKEGVCTDFTILTTTLLRAAGIPSRTAAGLVTGDGTFYYHAWSEAWDGHRWVGVDSVLEEEQFSASHIKLIDGQAEDWQKLNYPDPVNVKIKILSTNN